jgi:hypothetical protein
MFERSYRMSWPEAFVSTTAIATVGLVVAVIVWQVFRTGQTAIREERGSLER